MVITILSLGGKGNSEYRRDVHKKLKCFFYDSTNYSDSRRKRQQRKWPAR